MELSPRPLTPEDLDAVVAIEARVHPAPWSRQGFEGEFRKPFCRAWVLTDDETDSTIAAYLVFWTLNGEGYLLNVAVDLPYRGTGLAKLLVRRMITVLWTEKVNKIKLEVRKSNLPAVALYQGLGFNICQVRRQFYSNGEDAYVMELAQESADSGIDL